MSQGSEAAETSTAAEPVKERRGPSMGTQLLLEFLSVAVGVLLALVVNEWREDRASQQRAAKALNNVNREIRANRDHLLQAHETNLAAEKRWEGAQGGPADADASVGGESDGSSEMRLYMPAWGLQSSVWRAALDSGALDAASFDAVASLSAIYIFQETYLDLVRQLSQAQMIALLLRDDEEPMESLRQMDRKQRVYIDALLTNERQLLDWYDRALEYGSSGERAE